MNSTTRETTPSSASARLISREIKRLIFWRRRSCCSVCSSRCSSSLTRDTGYIMPDRALASPGIPRGLHIDFLHRFGSFGGLGVFFRRDRLRRGRGGGRCRRSHHYGPPRFPLIFRASLVKCCDRIQAASSDPSPELFSPHSGGDRVARRRASDREPDFERRVLGNLSQHFG